MWEKDKRGLRLAWRTMGLFLYSIDFSKSSWWESSGCVARCGSVCESVCARARARERVCVNSAVSPSSSLRQNSSPSRAGLIPFPFGHFSLPTPHSSPLFSFSLSRAREMDPRLALSFSDARAARLMIPSPFFDPVLFLPHASVSSPSPS